MPSLWKSRFQQGTPCLIEMNWIKMDTEEAFDNALRESFNNNGIAIFKHSTRCAISSVAKNRLSSNWDFSEELPIYYLDLIQYRELSNLISEKLNITHQSPQILIVKNGKCVYDNSHMSISVKSLHNFFKN